MKKHQTINKKKSNMLKTKRILIFAVPSVIFLVVIIAIGSYVSSLINLVKAPDFTGDPSLNESDIFNPDDYVTTALTTTTRPVQTTLKPGDPTIAETTIQTTIETTIDPLVILAEEYEAVLAGLPMASDKQVYNILLIGTDNRGDELNGRSDTMIILSVNRRTDQIQIVSLMRALYVKIPGRGYSMLNAAFSWGGAKLLIRTIEENFRIPIHDYILINFSGFTQTIDLVGGITVNLTEAETGYMIMNNPGVELIAGENLLNGELALTYARIRKIDSDFTRTGRQRTVIEALIRKIGQMSLTELDEIARQILPLVKSSRTGSSMLSLVADAYAWRNYPIRQLMIPVSKTYDLIIVRNAQMYRFDVQTNVEKLQQFLYQ